MSAAVVLVSGAALAAEHTTKNFDTSTAYSATSCGGTPTLAADTTADDSGGTPLGVNATSTGQLASATAEFGHLPVIRVYYTGMPDPNAWTTGAAGINHSAVVLSFRVPPATILSGVDDAALAHFFDTAPTGSPIYYSYYHEPEPFIENGTFTLAQYKAAWTHIVAIADAAHNLDLQPTLILMGWDLDSRSGINFKDYLPAGHVINVLGWDAYPAGTIENKDPRPTVPADFMGAAVAASKSVGLPFGFAEFALGTQTDRPQWLTQVASYLRSSGALFGTLFNSTGFPWMELNDSSSIASWRAAVADSGGRGAPLPKPSPSPTSSRPAPSSPPPTVTPTPTPTKTASQPPGPAPTSGVPVITEPSVSPGSFTPTGTNHVRIMFKLDTESNVSICILDSQGNVLRELDTANESAGWGSDWYFGHDTAGNLLPTGVYSVLIVASDDGGIATAKTTLTITS